MNPSILLISCIVDLYKLPLCLVSQVLENYPPKFISLSGRQCERAHWSIAICEGKEHYRCRNEVSWCRNEVKLVSGWIKLVLQWSQNEISLKASGWYEHDYDRKFNRWGVLNFGWCWTSLHVLQFSFCLLFYIGLNVVKSRAEQVNKGTFGNDKRYSCWANVIRKKGSCGLSYHQR